MIEVSKTFINLMDAFIKALANDEPLVNVYSSVELVTEFESSYLMLSDSIKILENAYSFDIFCVNLELKMASNLKYASSERETSEIILTCQLLKFLYKAQFSKLASVIKFITLPLGSDLFRDKNGSKYIDYDRGEILT